MTFFDIVPSDRNERVMAYLEEKGAASAMEIADRFDINKSTTYRILRNFYRDGKVRIEIRHPDNISIHSYRVYIPKNTTKQ